MVRATVSKKRSASSDESESENEYQVEAIVDKRTKGKRIQYLLKWKGYSDADNTVSVCFCSMSIDERRSFSGKIIRI